MNTTFTRDERRKFDLNATRYQGDGELPGIVCELVSDWGTGLNANLYRRAVLSCARHEKTPELKSLPMTSERKQIGNQRFHLLNSDTALGVTTFRETTNENVVDFQKLLSASPLSRLHWLNVTHRHVTLATILSD